jgi:hypothetical protein
MKFLGRPPFDCSPFLSPPLACLPSAADREAKPASAIRNKLLTLNIVVAEARSGGGGAGGDVQDQRAFKAVRRRCLGLEQRPSQAPAGFRHAGSRAVGDVRCLDVRCSVLAIGCDNTPRARVCSLRRACQPPPAWAVPACCDRCREWLAERSTERLYSALLNSEFRAIIRTVLVLLLRPLAILSWPDIIHSIRCLTPNTARNGESTSLRCILRSTTVYFMASSAYQTKETAPPPPLPILSVSCCCVDFHPLVL